jgi:hypothetical protein
MLRQRMKKIVRFNKKLNRWRKRLFKFSRKTKHKKTRCCSSSPISALPVELVQYVASFLAIKDWSALSRTSRYLHSALRYKHIHLFKTFKRELCTLRVIHYAGLSFVEYSPMLGGFLCSLKFDELQTILPLLAREQNGRDLIALSLMMCLEDRNLPTTLLILNSSFEFNLHLTYHADPRSNYITLPINHSPYLWNIMRLCGKWGNTLVMKRLIERCNFGVFEIDELSFWTTWYQKEEAVVFLTCLLRSILS